MVKGVTWLMIGLFFGRLSVFATRIVAARILGKVSLGEYGLIESTVNMFVAYAGLGMVVAISKNLAESFRADSARAGRILGTVCLVSGPFFILLLSVFFVSSQGLAPRLSSSPSFLHSLRIGMILSLQIPGGLAAAILNAFQSFRHVTYANIIQGLTCLALTLLLAPTWGLDGVILAFGAGWLLMFLYQVVIIRQLCLKHNIRLDWSGLRQEFPLIWRYGLPSMLAGLFIGPVTWATRAILARQAGGMAELGLYVAAYSLCAILMTSAALLTNVTLPVLSAAQTPEGKGRAMSRNLFVYWAVALILVVPLIALANFIVKILLGPDFSKSVPVLQILAVAIGIRVFYSGLGVLLIILDRVWYMTLSTVFSDPLFLGLAVLMTPRWGGRGLALAFLLSSCLTLVLMSRKVMKELRWRRISYFGVAVSLVAVALAWGVQEIQIIWLGVASTLCLVMIMALTLLYFALRSEMLGEMASKMPFLMKFRYYVR
jgi:O-antigen/teichoic acid export membrane protein